MTLIRNVKAIIVKSPKQFDIKKGKAVIRFTSDNLGETLSVEADGIQITMKYKDVERIIDRERAMHYTNGHAIIDETGEGFEA